MSSNMPIKWEFDPNIPTHDFFDAQQPEDDLGQALDSFLYNIERNAFATWEAVICEEQDIPLTRQQERLLDGLLDFGDPDDGQVLFINDIPRTTEPWYEILRKLAPHLLVEPYRTSGEYYDEQCEGWGSLTECLREHGKGLSLPEGAASPVEVVPPELRHKLWLQWCFDELHGLGQAENITLEEQPDRIDQFLARLQKCKDSVEHFNLTLDSLLRRVILPEQDQRLFIEMMQEKLGLKSDAEPLLDAIERLPEPEGDDCGDEECEPKFAVDDRVRVKWGAVDPDWSDLPIGGWTGTVTDVDYEDDHVYDVRWSLETLDAAHPVYKKRCDRDGLFCDECWVMEDDLEPDPGGPLLIEQPTEIIAQPLSMDDVDDRVRMALGLTTDDAVPLVGEKWLRRYQRYLKDTLFFPLKCRYRDEEDTLTVVGMSDYPLDEEEGIMVKVHDGKHHWEAPLHNLDINLDIEENDGNSRLLGDCIYWHFEFGDFPVTSRRDDFNAFGDYDTEPEPADDTIVSEQKVRRNAPCPCGSGKKFKKCCLKKAKNDPIT